MKRNRFVVAALLVFGAAFGASSQAVAYGDAVYQCCGARQTLCEDAYGPARCRGVFERRRTGNSCNTNDF